MLAFTFRPGPSAGIRRRPPVRSNGSFEVAWQGRDANNSVWLATGAGASITAKGDPYALGVA